MGQLGRPTYSQSSQALTGEAAIETDRQAGGREQTETQSPALYSCLAPPPHCVDELGAAGDQHCHWTGPEEGQEDGQGRTGWAGRRRPR